MDKDLWAFRIKFSPVSTKTNKWIILSWNNYKMANKTCTDFLNLKLIMINKNSIIIIINKINTMMFFLELELQLTKVKEIIKWFKK